MPMPHWIHTGGGFEVSGWSAPGNREEIMPQENRMVDAFSTVMENQGVLQHPHRPYLAGYRPGGGDNS